MSLQSEELRKRAADDRAAADETTLQNAKAKLMTSAARNDELAEQAERLEQLKQGRSPN